MADWCLVAAVHHWTPAARWQEPCWLFLSRRSWTPSCCCGAGGKVGGEELRVLAGSVPGTHTEATVCCMCLQVCCTCHQLPWGSKAAGLYTDAAAKHNLELGGSSLGLGPCCSAVLGGGPSGSSAALPGGCRLCLALEATSVCCGCGPGGAAAHS
jgi:hypothetical protein